MRKSPSDSRVGTGSLQICLCSWIFLGPLKEGRYSSQSHRGPRGERWQPQLRTYTYLRIYLLLEPLWAS